MFPQTDEISTIISDAIKVAFKRRLVDRVLRLWLEMALGLGFPRLDQIEPSKLGVDWANCFMIAVQSPLSLSYFAICGVNLSFAFCPDDSLAGVLLSHLPGIIRLTYQQTRCSIIPKFGTSISWQPEKSISAIPSSIMTTRLASTLKSYSGV